jgi:hypothetical protein
MKKILTSLLLLCMGSALHAQILCIYCYDQNDSISQNVNNLILNGGFENTTCAFNSNANTFCPNSVNYNCDIMNWICTGGGSGSYSCFYDLNFWYVQSGTHSAYFGNSFCPPCNSGDTSCLVNTDCETTGISPGYPLNQAAFGGALGLSLEQTVNGLTPGATYVLEFWAGGEDMGSFPIPGLFGLDIGFGYTYLRNNATMAFTGIGKRYVVVFNATSTSHVIKFTNWGHICNDCTELVLDDVRLYTLAELSPIVPACAGANVTVLFTAPNHICPGTCTNFVNLSLNATSFQWSFPGGNPSVSTDASPTGICYNTPGTYPVSLIGSNGITGDTLTLNNYITVYPYPPPQGILQSGDTLFANQGATSYQWFLNGNIITGATDYFYLATASGDYNVVATDENDCEVEAVINDVVAATTPLSFGEGSGVRLFPNPVNDKLEIKNLDAGTNVTIIIYNNIGEKVFESSKENVPEHLSIDLNSVSTGLYFLEVRSGPDRIMKMFTKQ